MPSHAARKLALTARPQLAAASLLAPTADPAGRPAGSSGSGLARLRRTARQLRPARRPHWLGWPALGLVLLLMGLLLPWFAVPLQTEPSAWSLPVVLAGMPSAPVLSYGAILLGCLALGLVAMVRSQGRPGAATAAVGVAVLILSLVFLVATRTADWPLLQRLEDQTAQQTAIFGQFGYGVPGQEPTLMVLVPVTGTWALVAGALRLGWFAAIAGGLVLFGSGASSLAAWLRPDQPPDHPPDRRPDQSPDQRPRRRRLLLPALVLLLVAGVLGRGVVAGYLAGQGVFAYQGGNDQAASSRLSLAQKFNPLLTSSTAYELALGQVLLAGGGAGQPLALLADANARGAGGDIRGQVTDLRQAVARDPANSVLREQLDQASQILGLSQDDAGALQALAGPTVADEYTQGRVLYARADYPAALTCFRRVLGMTGDANVTSSALTYLALSELKLGQAGPARRDLLRAVSVDTGYNNTLARSLVVGLYVGTKSGAA